MHGTAAASVRSLSPRCARNPAYGGRLQGDRCRAHKRGCGQQDSAVILLGRPAELSGPAERRSTVHGCVRRRCGADCEGLRGRAVSGAAGIVSLFVNQAGGKLSDSLGRKQLFMLGPLCNVLANVWVFRSGSSSLAVLMVCKVVRLVFSTFSGSTMAMAGLMDISSAQEMAQMGARLQTSAGIGECALGH